MSLSSWVREQIETRARHHRLVWVHDPYRLLEDGDLSALKGNLRSSSYTGGTTISAGTLGMGTIGALSSGTVRAISWARVVANHSSGETSLGGSVLSPDYLRQPCLEELRDDSSRTITITSL